MLLLGWLSPLGSAGDSPMQIDDSLFEIHRIVMPRLTVDSWGRLLLEIEETATENRLYLCERFDAQVARRIASLEAKATG